MKKTQQELAAEISQSLIETAELLKKSQYMQKEDDKMQPEEDTAEVPPQAEGESGEVVGDAAPETPAEEVPAEGEGEMSLEQHLDSMSEEDLHALIEAALSTLEARAGGNSVDGEEMPEAPAPQVPSEESPMEKSIKTEHEAMKKSIADLTDLVSKQAGTIETLQKSQVKPAAPKVTTRPAPANKVEVLKKSEAAAPQRLQKSETVQFLLGKQREGNRHVNSDVISRANACRSDADLHELQDNLTKLGMIFPKI